MDLVGLMHDIPENPRRMDFDSHENRRRGWLSIRDFCQSFQQSHGHSDLWRISWIARCTWIPAINKATSRRGNRGPKKVKKHHIVDALVALYITIIAIAVIATMVLSK